MSIIVYYDYDDPEDLKNKLNYLCDCGHKLGEHGFTENFNYASGKHYLRVSQCVRCECEEYRYTNDLPKT